MDIGIKFFNIDGNPDSSIINDDGDLEIYLTILIDDETVNMEYQASTPTTFSKTIELNVQADINSTIQDKNIVFAQIKVPDDRGSFVAKKILREESTNSGGENVGTNWEESEFLIPFSNEIIQISWDNPYKVIIGLRLEYSIPDSNTGESSFQLPLISISVLLALNIKMRRKV